MRPMTKQQTASRIKKAPLTLEKGCSARGADMGRVEWLPRDSNATGLLQLRRLRLIDGGYDEGGAYFGYPEDVYHAEGDLDGEPTRTRLFTRADSRRDAKDNIRERLPNVRFFR